MSKVLSGRVPDELAEWADSYAAEHGLTRAAVLEAAMIALREDAAGGVPDVVAKRARQKELIRKAIALHGRIEGAHGVGNCPERPGELGHIWDHRRENEGDVPYTVCAFCELRGKVFFEQATAERTELFSSLRSPASVRGGKK